LAKLQRQHDAYYVERSKAGAEAAQCGICVLESAGVEFIHENGAGRECG
jgi:hypothetical protein